VVRRAVRYELLERIGRGGMAEVWRARDRKTGAVVALKQVLPHFADDPRFIEMFLEETRLALAFDHPHIVRSLEVDELDGLPFLAMDLVAGCDLGRAITELSARGALSAGFAAFTTAGLCRGLAYLHGRADSRGRALSLVHRDVSPSNVLIGIDGSIKLADFGLAKAYAIRDASFTARKGKLAYMAPEQARGAPLDARADQFAAGAVLYHALVGRPPQLDSDGRLALKGGLAPATPAALETICLRALDPDPQGRFADCDSMAEALEAVAQGLGWDAARLGATLASFLQPVTDTTRGSATIGLAAPDRGRRLALAIGLVSVLAVGSIVMWRHKQAKARHGAVANTSSPVAPGPSGSRPRVELSGPGWLAPAPIGPAVGHTSPGTAMPPPTKRPSPRPEKVTPGPGAPRNVLSHDLMPDPFASPGAR
jgi:serine/threonine protein kinase